MKTIVLVVLMLLGCGAAENEATLGETLGQTQEAMTAPETASYVLGSSEGSGRLRCNRTSTGQVCDVPEIRVFKYCAENLTPSQLLQISTLDSAGSSSDGHFSWSGLVDGSGHLVTGAACDTALSNGTAQVMVNQANNICASSVVSSANIDTFVCYSPTLGVGNLPKVPSTTKGTFNGMHGGIIHIDTARLAQFFTEPDLSRVLQHGLGHAAVGLDGLGARTESTLQFCYSYRPTFPISTLGLTKTNGEDCSLRFFSASPTGQYVVDSTNCVGITPE